MIGLDWLVSTRVAADVAALVFVKGTVLLLTMIAVGYVARRRSAAFRHRVWVLGLFGLLALPLADRVVPAWGDVGLVYPGETALLGVDALETNTLARDAEGNRVVISDEPAQLPVDMPFDIPVSSLLLLLWWTGLAAALTRLAADLVRVSVLRRTSLVASPDHCAFRMIEAERVRAGIRRPVTLLIHAREGLAATVGTLRPAVVLGPDVAAMPAAQLRSVLLHELAHVRRGDFLANLLSSIATLLYWPNPLFWMARRRAALTLEQACDDEVLTGGVRSTDYANVLMHFAVARPSLSPAMRSTMGFLRLSPTRDRIFSILDAGLDRAPIGARTGLAAAALAAVLVIGVGSLNLLAYEPGTGPTAALIGDLSNEDAAIRARAARTLGRRDASAVRFEIEGLLDDPAADVRLAAAGVLEQLGDPGSIPAMARVLTRPFDGGRGEHGFVLKLAMKTLGKTDDPAAVRVLEAQLDRPVAQLRRLALEEVVGMQTQWPAALPHLERMSRNDPDQRNRGYATDALARLSQR